MAPNCEMPLLKSPNPSYAGSCCLSHIPRSYPGLRDPAWPSLNPSVIILGQARRAPTSRPLQFLVPRGLHGSHLTSFESHLKGHLLRKACSDVPFNIIAPSLLSPTEALFSSWRHL